MTVASVWPIPGNAGQQAVLRPGLDAFLQALLQNLDLRLQCRDHRDVRLDRQAYVRRQWQAVDRIVGQPFDLIAGHSPTELPGHDVFDCEDMCRA